MGVFTKKANFIILASISAVILIILIAAFFILNDGPTNVNYRDHHISFDDGWTMITGEQSTSDVSLPAHVKIPSGDSVVFRKTLPDEIPSDSAIISRNYHQILNIFIDGELIYSYPQAGWNGFGNIISDEWTIIDLHSEYSGKTMDVSFTNPSDFSFDAFIGEFYYGNDNSLIQHIKHMGFWDSMVSIIICVLGSILIIISFIYRAHTKQTTNLAMGLALLTFGVWLTNRARTDVFPEHSSFIYMVSLICLIMVAPCVLLYSYYRNAPLKKASLKSFQLCVIIDILLAVSCIFIYYDVQTVAMVAYGLTCAAVALNGYALFLSAFGKDSKNLSKIELLLNRTEFFTNLLFPLGIIPEVIMYSDRLWTDVSLYYRMALMIYSWAYMFLVLWRTYLVVQDRTNVTKRLQESQLELMMGQIQPHFIFNTLSSIRTLVMVDPKIAYNMLYDFSNYLRANIDNVTNPGGIKFAAEVNHIKSYVNIEKVRFGDRLNVEYDIQADDFSVPPLSIQPFIENAIKHGVCKKVEGGTVYLKSYDNEKYNIVEINDEGVGFSQDAANRTFYFYGKSATSMESNRIILNAMNEVIESITLLDAAGNQIKITNPIAPDNNLSGTGAEKHKSTGMLNILMRLKEISNATVNIYSQEGVGTNIKVLFPKSNELLH